MRVAFKKLDTEAVKQLAIQAPIPLKSNMASDKFGEAVKYKLRRDPNDPNSEHYMAMFKPWKGSSIEDYCRMAMNLQEVVTNLPCHTIAEVQTHGVQLLADQN